MNSTAPADASNTAASNTAGAMSAPAS
jgi:hypothetical protein